MVLNVPGTIDQSVIWSNYNYVKIVKILFDCMHLGYKKASGEIDQDPLSFSSQNAIKSM